MKSAVTLTCLLSTTLAAAQREPTASERPARVTFSEHVAPIIHRNCASCHRPGEIGPFSLLSYRDVRKRARMIVRVTESRYMPPWHPEPGWGEFRDARRLSDAEIGLLRSWADGGREEGPKEALPELPSFPNGWQLGQPDLVVTMPRAYEVPAGGPDIYRNFVVPLGTDEQRWVRAVEIRPSARSVLHHCLFWLDDSGRARELDGQDGQPGFGGMGFRRSGSLGGWAVGGTPRFLPMELAMPLPKGSDLILASHFHPTGKPERERTTVGLYFAAEAPKQTLLTFQVPPQYGAFAAIDIPAGEAMYRVVDSWTLPCDIELVGVGGHAHYIGKSMQAVARLPDGGERRLFRIKDWDFNWQGRYHYQEPVALPKGTVITTELVYDNSAANPRNPNQPPKRIRWGLQSTDEMGSVIFTCVASKESDVAVFRRAERAQRNEARARRARGRRDDQARLLEGIRALDKDEDGEVERAEVPERWHRLFDRLDRNGDGVLDADEIAALRRRERR